MIPDETPPVFGSGHNSDGLLGLVAALDDFRALLNERPQAGDKTFAMRRDEFVRAATAAVVRDRGTAGAAADVIKLAAAVRDKIEAERKERTDPYREVAVALKGEADEFWAPVADAIEALETRIREWVRVERQRIADQKREQADALEAMAPKPVPAAPAAPAKRRPVRGDLGGTIRQVDRIEYSVTDVRAVPDWILNSDTVKEAIIAVVKSVSKHSGDIPGIKTTPVSDIRTR